TSKPPEKLSKSKGTENKDKRSKKVEKTSKKKKTDEVNSQKKKVKKSSKKKSESTTIPERITTSEETKNDTNIVETHVNATPVKTLVDSDDIQIVFTLNLASLKENTNEPPTLIANFSIRNKCSLRVPFSQFTFTFESTSDIQFDNTLIEIGDLQYEEKRNMSVEFKVLGIVGVGLTVSGNITYTTQSDENKTSHDIPIRFELPLAVFMLNIPRTSPEQFANLISQIDFPFTGSTTIRFNATIHSVEQAFQNEMIRLTSFATGTHIVEQVPGAITIYGSSVQGYQVVGLAKLLAEQQLMVDEDESSNMKASIKVELKCTDQAFVDGLIREIEHLFSEEL
ncbi:10610_t:CDS:2, partial [Acaulospora morrowiae]